MKKKQEPRKNKYYNPPPFFTLASTFLIAIWPCGVELNWFCVGWASVTRHVCIVYGDRIVKVFMSHMKSISVAPHVCISLGRQYIWCQPREMNLSGTSLANFRQFGLQRCKTITSLPQPYFITPIIIYWMNERAIAVFYNCENPRIALHHTEERTIWYRRSCLPSALKIALFRLCHLPVSLYSVAQQFNLNSTEWWQGCLTINSPLAILEYWHKQYTENTLNGQIEGHRHIAKIVPRMHRGFNRRRTVWSCWSTQRTNNGVNSPGFAP